MAAAQQQQSDENATPSMAATEQLPVPASERSSSPFNRAAQVLAFVVVGAIALAATVPRKWLAALVPGYEKLGASVAATPHGGPKPEPPVTRLATAIHAAGQGQYTQAAVVFEQLAKDGDAEAQHQLGTLYYNGRGVPHDDALSADWHRKAAEQGHAHSQYDLGVHYQLGRGVTQSDSEALVWYRKAAAQGWSDAQAKLKALNELP